MSVLCDWQIEARCTDDPPMIDPFRPDNVQPASLDVTLGSTFRVYDNQKVRAIDLNDSSTYEALTSPVKIKPGNGFNLHPGEFVLCGTEEFVRIPADLGARIEGKSSLGRLGLVIHATAGFIDPGFNGVVTLEMTNWQRVPIILYPGNLIAQLSFFVMDEIPNQTYKGRYQGDAGVAPSRFMLPTKAEQAEKDLREIEYEKGPDGAGTYDPMGG